MTLLGQNKAAVVMTYAGYHNGRSLQCPLLR